MGNTSKTLTSYSRLWFLMFLFCLIFGMLTGAMAHADQLSSAHRPWVDALRKAARSQQLEFERIDLASGRLEVAVLKQLSEIAFAQAQIWGDTILEGDYSADRKIELDSVELVHFGGAPIAWRITYSAAAFETSDCTPSQGSMAGCTPGRIVEASYVSSALDAWVRDETRFAEFQPTSSAVPANRM